MAYFIFNPQTNQLDDSDNPTPIRENLGQRFLAGGGRVEFSKGSPFVITDEILETIHGYITDSDLNLKEIGKKINFGTEKKPMDSTSKVFQEYIKKFGKPDDIRLQTKGVKLVEDSPYVQKIIKSVEDKGVTQTSKTLGKHRKTIRNVLHQFRPDLIKPINDPGEITSAKKSKITSKENIKLSEKKAGVKTTKQAKAVIADIGKLNNDYADMLAKDLANDKEFLNRLRMQIDQTTGNVTFNGYTKKAPVGGKVFNDLELAEHAIKKANQGQLFTDDHIIPKSLKKQNIGYPTNFQPATYMENSQFDNARRYVLKNPDANTASIDKYLTKNNQTLRFPDKKIKLGYKGPIVFDSKTGTQTLVKKAAKTGIKKAIGTALGTTVGLANEAFGAPLGKTVTLPTKAGEWLGEIPLTLSGAVQDWDKLVDMGRSLEDKKYAGGGPVIPRIGYRDGPTLGDARGWENMLDKDNPETMAKLEALKVLQDQKTADYRKQAHEKRLLHRTDDYYTSQEESFIPHYVQDVAKTTFGTDAGRKYFGSKVAEGAIEGTEWLVMQIPHLLAQTNPIGLMKMQKKMDEGNFSWMDLLYEPKLGEKLGMNDYQQKKLEELREQAIAEGKPGIPQGVETLGTTGELGAMFADPFMMYGAYRKLAPALKGSQAKIRKSGIEEQVDEGKRDTLKTLGTGGLMVALAKIFPGIFKGGKAKVASKVAKTNYVKQFGNVRGMPDWFPSFMLKATQKGKLKSLPDRDYIEPMVYELMLPVKRYNWSTKKYYTEKVPVTVTQNPRDGGMSVTWTGTDNYGEDISRTIDYTPGQTGTQNYAADEYGRGVSKEEVVIQDPEFNYTEPDYSSMSFEDTSPDSASFLDIHDEGDEIVEAMEAFVKGTDDKFKKKAADEFRLYNQTDEHFGNATGHQTQDGDWVSGEDNMSFPSYDKEVKDVYHPTWNRKKKAMGGVASGPPPLSGPVPQGLPSLQPGDIYNEWIK